MFTGQVDQSLSIAVTFDAPAIVAATREEAVVGADVQHRFPASPPSSGICIARHILSCRSLSGLLPFTRLPSGSGRLCHQTADPFGDSTRAL